ncbi:MAG: molybdopterin oxidoreductase, partial [Actinoallomurus sp.]|nr:molybdopterin oxidoreductase [Actinoallomurus sp.]
PGLLPIGRPVTDAGARAEVARAWGVSGLPDTPGLDSAGILAAARDERIDALLIGGVDPYDLPDPTAVLAALEATPFIVSLEQRVSAVTDRADVVLPVAVITEKAGTFVNWEGRGRPFEAVLKVPQVMSDLKVLSAIADLMDVHLGLPDSASARRELAALGGFKGTRPSFPSVSAAVAAEPGAGEAVLATWRMLLDAGRLQDGEPYLAGTAKTPVARMSAATAEEIGAEGKVTVATGHGEITLPLEITDMPDRVVWLPANSPGSAVYRDLGVQAGGVVKIQNGSVA